MADDVVEPAVAAVAVAVDPGLSKRDSDAEREVNITRTITRVRSSTIASEALPPPPGSPDGTWIEFVETHKVPILKKIGWYIHLKKRKPGKSLPRFILKMMGLNRVKD